MRPARVGANRTSRHAWLELAAVLLAKLALAGAVLAAGFSHVSDDDFARTVIAETFAHAPKLDPSGTSWLPLPFWIAGGAMMLFGRSLATARVVAVLLGMAAPVLVWLALRARGEPRPALLATTAFALPWLAWASIATVPEAICAGLASAGILGLSRREPLSRADVGFAACVCAACLCRYEAWAVALVAAIVVARRAMKSEGSRILVVALVALTLLGPLAWMSWNAHAHGDALHFLARVARFRKATGQSGGSLATRLLFYPRAAWEEQRELVVMTCFVALGAGLRRPLRVAFAWPLLACLAVVAFLVAGSLGDGAPTHHPARALSIIAPIIVAAALSLVAQLASSRGARALGRVATPLSALAMCAAAWLFAETPGRTAAEDRAPQIARGLELRSANVASFSVTPCAYEHFALIAAFGAPERVVVKEPEMSETKGPDEPQRRDACPRVEVAR